MATLKTKEGNSCFQFPAARWALTSSDKGFTVRGGGGGGGGGGGLLSHEVAPVPHPSLSFTIGSALFESAGRGCFLLVEICDVNGGHGGLGGGWGGDGGVASREGVYWAVVDVQTLGSDCSSQVTHMYITLYLHYIYIHLHTHLLVPGAAAQEACPPRPSSRKDAGAAREDKLGPLYILPRQNQVRCSAEEFWGIQ